MKKLGLFIILFLGVFLSQSWGQTTIKIQDFEDPVGTPTWSYTGGGSIQSDANRFNGTASYRFSGSQQIVMDNVDITSYSNVKLYVAFAANGPDSGEDLFLDISYDNGSTWNGTGSVKLVDGFGNTNLLINQTSASNPTTVATNPWIVNIADVETQVKVRFRIATASGGTEYYYVDDVKLTGTLSSGARLIIEPSSLSDFNYVLGNGPSASKSYSLSGTDLTGFPNNITITAPTNYEVSTDDIDFGNSKTVAYSSATLNATTIYVRLKSGLSNGVYNNELVANAGGGATTVNVTCNGVVYKAEPTNHVTNFNSSAGTPAHSAITLTWTDAVGDNLPDGYLIRGSSVSYADILTPTNGNPVADGELIKNVVHVSEGSYSFTGLNPSTKYYFKIFPYANSGVNIIYKTNETVPQVERTTADTPPASLLLEENFDLVAASDLNGQNGWALIGLDGTNLLVSPTALTYSNYQSTSGLAADITSSRADDLGKSFTSSINSGDLYYSFLIRVIGTTGTGAYLTGMNTTQTATNYTGRFYAKTDGTNVNFGIAKSTETATYSETNYALNTTYLVVIKYSFVLGATNDQISLFVFESPSLPAIEPITPTVGPLSPSSADNASLGAIFLRQASGVPDLIIDGLRVSDGWSEAPLPVELASITASASGKEVVLSWTTKTEINSNRFEVERLVVNSNKWESIGEVAASGNSNSPKEYSFTDKLTFNRNVELQYRLKIVDNDGTYEYSKVVNAKSELPNIYSLSQNYPNPFNPSTVISYQLPEKNMVTLKVYNVIGSEVATLVNEVKESGSYSVTFNASKLSSGTYFYTITIGQFTQTRKLVVLK